MKTMGTALENIFTMILGWVIIVAWYMGGVISESWWALIPFYSWWVVIERAMTFYHILGM